MDKIRRRFPARLDLQLCSAVVSRFTSLLRVFFSCRLPTLWAAGSFCIVRCWFLSPSKYGVYIPCWPVTCHWKAKISPIWVFSLLQFHYRLWCAWPVSPTLTVLVLAHVHTSLPELCELSNSQWPEPDDIRVGFGTSALWTLAEEGHILCWRG